jgi:hypothetical protein
VVRAIEASTNSRLKSEGVENSRNYSRDGPDEKEIVENQEVTNQRKVLVRQLVYQQFHREAGIDTCTFYLVIHTGQTLDGFGTDSAGRIASPAPAFLGGGRVVDTCLLSNHGSRHLPGQFS